MRAPLSGAMLLFELTRDYDVVLPLVSLCSMLNLKIFFEQIASAGVASVVIEIFEFRREDDVVLVVEKQEKDGPPLLLAATQTKTTDAGDDACAQ